VRLASDDVLCTCSFEQSSSRQDKRAFDVISVRSDQGVVSFIARAAKPPFRANRFDVHLLARGKLELAARCSRC
jgi:hypothetical protein